MLQENIERISSVLWQITRKNAKIYTKCYEIGQFSNETAGRSSAKAGRHRDEFLSKRETDHGAG
jgi:hypothetical protein